MDYGKLAEKLKSGEFDPYVPPAAREWIDGADAETLLAHIRRVMKSPIRYANAFDRPLYQLYFIAAWAELFQDLYKGQELCVLEVATGDASYVVCALEHAFPSRGKYVTFNLNKKLGASFTAKNKDKKVKIRVVEDDGMHVLDYFSENTFDCIAFHHAVNDIVQTIIADMEGIDTVHCDWWEKEPEMLRAVMKHHRQGTFTQNVYGGFIRLMEVCARALKPGGHMIFDNRTFAVAEEIGYSTEFHDAYIDLARNFIGESGLPFTEIQRDGYDAKWWMILKKK